MRESLVLSIADPSTQQQCRDDKQTRQAIFLWPSIAKFDLMI